MRIYNEDGVLYLQIEYHGEYPLTEKRNKKVLHYHTYSPNFSLTRKGDFIRSKGNFLTEEIKKSYSKYFKGVKVT